MIIAVYWDEKQQSNNMNKWKHNLSPKYQAKIVLLSSDSFFLFILYIAHDLQSSRNVQIYLLSLAEILHDIYW